MPSTVTWSKEATYLAYGWVKDHPRMLLPCLVEVLAFMILAVPIIVGFGDASPVLIAAGFLVAGILTPLARGTVMFATLRSIHRGGPPDLRRGLREALGRWEHLLAWGLISATVSTAASVIEWLMDNWLGQLISLGTEGVWGFSTYFVLPEMIARRVGPVRAIRDTKDMLSSSIIGQLFGGWTHFLISILLLVVLAAIVLGAWMLLSEALAVALGVGLFILWLGLISTTHDVFRAMLYSELSGKKMLV